MINLTINNEKVAVKEGTTILEAAKKLNYKIPTLCYQENLSVYGGCRLCVVQEKGKSNLTIACAKEVEEGMEIFTHTKRVMKTRKNIFELIIANHAFDCEMNCLTCSKSNSCELKKVAEEIGVEELHYEFVPKPDLKEKTSLGVMTERSKCISCGRCVRTCKEIQSVGVLTMTNRGPATKVDTFLSKNLSDVDCTQCGQCIKACPTGAIQETYEINSVIQALQNGSKHVIVQMAPAVRVAIGEEFCMPPGTNMEKQVVTALRKIGFDKVFDTNFTADLTILEEGTEFIKRLNEGKNLPLITSCSPGWIKYAEHHGHDILDNLSTCKSPQQMFGALSKTYYPMVSGIDKKDIVTVSIMPCTAKKYEARREEMAGDVDFVLTTRELAKLIKYYHLDFVNLPEGEFDEPFGMSTGAGAIFGASGGVMEAALRTAYEVITGEELETIDFKNVRGLEGIKEAEVDIAGTKVKIAIASGLKNAYELLKNKDEYHFIEIMACPGGCLNGGGQPLHESADILTKRMNGLYSIDKVREYRKSHENPFIKKIYDEFLKEPLSQKSHELLHTTYKKR